ncbi:hypothetical protein WJX74_000814 [Apatococcus lobatus]|uniref:Globin family profile domain-containing protein n=1 Tax=Apatococcus lobatus TaxID=904363 RepID=A0AAW1QU68_9CHLO
MSGEDEHAPLKQSLYIRLGGRAAVDRAVTVFYDRLEADKRVYRFFANTDMRRLRRKLAEFVVYAFGGPNEYTGQDLVAAHKPVIMKGATVYHFDIVAEHFMGTLADMGVAKMLHYTIWCLDTSPSAAGLAGSKLLYSMNAAWKTVCLCWALLLTFTANSLLKVLHRLSFMTSHASAADIGASALQGVLGQHCLPWLGCEHLTSLRAASRATRELVDGPHAAWTEAAAGLLRPALQPAAQQTGAVWQAAIRKEWQAQQPLRTVTLQHVTKVKANQPGYGSFWVASPPPHSHCYLISKSAAGSLFLLNPSQPHVLPKQLALKPNAPYHAAVLPDGNLRYVQLGSSLLPPHQTFPDAMDKFGWDAVTLTWHILDPATGAILGSQQKYIWPLPSPKLDPMYHAGTRKVLGLVNVCTLAIMDAGTLQEVARCDISPRHEALAKRGTSVLHKVAWSSSGSMLAVAVCSNPQELRDMNSHWYAGIVAGSAMLAEIHIYEAATGQCLQSVPVAASDVRLWWSPSTDQLAVNTYRELWEERAADATAEQAGHSPVITSNSGVSADDQPSEGAAKPASPDGDLPMREDGDDSDPGGCPSVMEPALAHGLGSEDGLDSDNGLSSEDGLDSEEDVDDSMASVDDSMSGSSSDQGEYYHGQLWLLSPTSQKVDAVPCVPAAQWRSCEWSPHGRLLLARFGMCSSDLDGEGFSLVDPSTLEQVYSCASSAGSVSWASNSPSRLVKLSLSAAVTGVPALLNFGQEEHGEWHVMDFHQSKFSSYHNLCISSDGCMLVGARRRGAGGRAHAFHLPLADSGDGYVVPKSPIKSTGAWMQWAPLPAAWPQIYAYVHWTEDRKDEKGKISQPSHAALSLVDSRKLSVLGSWTAKELSSLVKGRKLRKDDTGEPQCVKWAPDGKHLAVLSPHQRFSRSFKLASR